MKQVYSIVIVFTVFLLFVIYKVNEATLGNIKVREYVVGRCNIQIQPDEAQKEKSVTVEEDYMLKASEFVLENNSQGAIEVLSEGIEKHPNNGDLYSMRGVHHHLIGKNEESLKDHEKAIELTNDKLRLASMYTNKAISEIALKQPENAERDFKKAPEYKEPYYITHLEYGKFLLDQGRKEQAVEVLKTARINLAKVGPANYFDEADALLKKVK